MNKAITTTALVVVAVFGSGYVVGQMRGTTPSSAATFNQSEAQTGTPGPTHRDSAGPHLEGQITAVNGDTITVKPNSEPSDADTKTSITTIMLTSATQYSTGWKVGASATRDAVKVGAYIRAEGTMSTDGKSLTATRVIVLPAGAATPPFGHDRPFGPRAGGQVTAVNGTTITVKPEVGFGGHQSSVTTITLTDTTTYSNGPDDNGTTAPTKDAVKVGSYIVAEGTVSTDGKTLTATRVTILPSTPTVGGFRHGGPGVLGQVTAVGTDSLTITPVAGRGGESTVTTIALTSGTQYFSGRDTAATKNAVSKGSFVMAEGQISTDGKTLTASRIVVLPSAPTFNGFGHGFGGHGTWSPNDQFGPNV